MSDNNSGTKTAEELQKLEQELEQEARDANPEPKEKLPSEFINDDDEDQKPPKKEPKKEVAKKDKEEDEDDDDDIDDIDDEDDEDKGDEDDKFDKDQKIPAWMVKMQERRFNKALEEEREKLRKEFEDEHGRKPNADEKKDLENDLIEDFKKEFGTEPDEDTTKFLKFLEKRAPKLNPEFTERMSKIEKDTQERLEEMGFEKDFSAQKKLIDKYFPDADSKALDRIKTKVKELAYTEKYAKYSLDDIIRLNRKALTPVDRKKTGEPSRGGAGQARYTADQVDPDNIDWDSMDVEEAEKVMTALEKKQGQKSRVSIYRKGKKIN